MKAYEVCTCYRAVGIGRVYKDYEFDNLQSAIDFVVGFENSVPDETFIWSYIHDWKNGGKKIYSSSDSGHFGKEIADMFFSARNKFQQKEYRLRAIKNRISALQEALTKAQAELAEIVG